MGINAVWMASGFQGRVWELGCSDFQFEVQQVNHLMFTMYLRQVLGGPVQARPHSPKACQLDVNGSSFSIGMGKVAFTNSTSTFKGLQILEDEHACPKRNSTPAPERTKISYSRMKGKCVAQPCQHRFGLIHGLSTVNA